MASPPTFNHGKRFFGFRSLYIKSTAGSHDISPFAFDIDANTNLNYSQLFGIRFSVEPTSGPAISDAGLDASSTTHLVHATEVWGLGSA